MTEAGRIRACVLDVNGNTWESYADNRAGRRAVERHHRVRTVRKPCGRIPVAARIRATAHTRSGYRRVGCSAQSKPLSWDNALALASGRERISGGAAATFYVRKTGSDSNGGSSSGTAPDATNTDGVTAGTTTFTSAGANFQPGDVDKAINIVGKGRYRITARASTTSITLSGSPSAGSGLTYNVGGAVLTVGALLTNANAVAAGGDSIYVGAGVYRETNVVVLAPGSGLSIIGDTDGAKTGDAGAVILSNYTTNDKTAASANAIIGGGGKNNYLWSNIVFSCGGGAYAFDMFTSNSGTGWTWTNCGFLHSGSAGALSSTSAATTALNWTFDRCIVHASGNNINFSPTGSGSGSDWDLNVTFQNTVFTGPTITVFGSASTRNGGGVRVFSCTSLSANYSLLTVSGVTGRVTPCFIFNCHAYSLAAGTTGQYIEDYNIFTSSGAASNAHSISLQTAGGFFMGAHMELIWGGQLRPWWEPIAGAYPLLAVKEGRAASKVSGTQADDSTIGTTSWATLTNLGQIDAAFATSTLPTTSSQSHYIKATNFGFAIPSDATIVGVLVEHYSKAAAAAAIQANHVKLVKGGTISGNDNGNATTLTTTVAYYLHGATNDLWGLALTPTDINASTFGCAVAFINTTAMSRVVSVDMIRMTVIYELGSGGIAVDVRNAPRVGNGTNARTGAAGASGRGNTAAKETSTTHSGTASGKIVGDGWHDFVVPVDASATTFTLYMRYDGTYDATVGRPQLLMLANGECGVAAQTVTVTAGASGAWEQQTIGPFTPTAKGYVTLRVVSRDINGAGSVFFDSFAAA